jgi:hypothetical protein
LASDAVILGYVGLAGLMVTSVSNIILALVGHRKIEEVRQEAASAYEEANGFNQKLKSITEEKKAKAVSA